MNNYSEGFQLGEWRVYPTTGVLNCNGVECRAEPKVMDLLLALIDSPEQFGSREQLLAKVWPDVVVNEEVLTRAVSELRTLLGETGRHRRYIMTIPKRGYKLLLTPGALSPESRTDKQFKSTSRISRWVNWLLVGKLAHYSVVVSGYLLLGAGTWLHWTDAWHYADAPGTETHAVAQSVFDCEPTTPGAAVSKIEAA